MKKLLVVIGFLCVVVLVLSNDKSTAKDKAHDLATSRTVQILDEDMHPEQNDSTLHLSTPPLTAQNNPVKAETQKQSFANKFVTVARYACGAFVLLIFVAIALGHILFASNDSIPVENLLAEAVPHTKEELINYIQNLRTRIDSMFSSVNMEPAYANKAGLKIACDRLIQAVGNINQPAYLSEMEEARKSVVLFALIVEKLEQEFRDYGREITFLLGKARHHPDSTLACCLSEYLAEVKETATKAANGVRSDLDELSIYELIEQSSD